MKHTYTPGPWQIFEVVDHPSNKREQIAFIQNPKVCFDLSAVERSYFSRDEFKANAQLISAAPELLEGLKQIESLCDNNNPEHNQIWNIAYCLIDKATNPDCKQNSTK